MYDPNYESEYAKAVADAVLSDGLIDPLASPMIDYEVHRRREQVLKELPLAPNTDQCGHVEAVIENLVKSGRLDNGESAPQTLQQLDDELRAAKERENEARIRQIIFGKLP
jgi:hypothetical protein